MSTTLKALFLVVVQQSWPTSLAFRSLHSVQHDLVAPNLKGLLDPIKGEFGKKILKPKLKYTRVKGKPFNGKLKACEGDCNSDKDCANGLKCFQRDGRYASALVPGCSSKDLGKPNIDYCYKPPKLVDYGIKGKRLFGRKLGACQGDCDSDSDCKKNLRCMKVARGQRAVVPGCSGKGKDGFDYCYSPNGASTKGRNRQNKGNKK